MHPFEIVRRVPVYPLARVFSTPPLYLCSKSGLEVVSVEAVLGGRDGIKWIGWFWKVGESYGRCRSFCFGRRDVKFGPKCFLGSFCVF
ncbi:hypothetical protein EV2_037062 [Malus domestica]